MTYVILYTNDITVQGVRIYYLVSRVNILLQGKVQRLTPPSPMQVLTVVLYHTVRVIGLISRCQFHSCGELLEFFLFNE